MSEIPGDLLFLKSHEWVRINDDETATVGISDHAQQALGDLVYVELPEVGSTVDLDVDVGKGVAVVESVKAASDIYSPLSGQIVEVNELLSDKPETINEDPYGDGWLFKIKYSKLAEKDDLLGPDDYNDLVENEDH
jgi:glycine cleavage system H protein